MRVLTGVIILLPFVLAILSSKAAVAESPLTRQVFLPQVSISPPTPTATPTPSPTATPTVSPTTIPTYTPIPTPAGGGTELASNGGFEAGLADWTIQGPATLISQGVYDGKYSVQWAGTPGMEVTTKYSQTIAIPSCVRTGMLSFATRYNAVAGAPGTPSMENGLELEVIDPTLGPYVVVGIAPDPARNGLWTVYDFPSWWDISGIAGHTVTLSVGSWIGPDDNILWSVDDVEFLVSC